MPELPEVEIIKRSLKKKINFQRIIGVKVNNRNLRFKLKKNFSEKILNKKVVNVYRKAKYLIISLDNKTFILIHFGMSGTFHLIKKREKDNLFTNLSFYQSRNLPKKHNHIEIHFKNFKVIYNDPRRFGFFKLLDNKKNLEKYLSKNGLEPFSKKFNFNYLLKNICFRSKNIKNILLDQRIVSGIGNIYANEILFCSGIDPNKPGNKLNKKEIKNLEILSKKILNKAILKGGSTIRDFKHSDGKAGKFQNEFKVYSQDNKNCPNLNCNYKITKINISNRSTFYCKNCQK